MLIAKTLLLLNLLRLIHLLPSPLFAGTPFHHGLLLRLALWWVMHAPDGDGASVDMRSFPRLPYFIHYCHMYRVGQWLFNKRWEAFYAGVAVPEPIWYKRMINIFLSFSGRFRVDCIRRPNFVVLCCVCVFGSRVGVKVWVSSLFNTAVTVNVMSLHGCVRRLPRSASRRCMCRPRYAWSVALILEYDTSRVGSWLSTESGRVARSHVI